MLNIKNIFSFTKKKKTKESINIEQNIQPIVNVYNDGWVNIPLIGLLESSNIDSVIEQLKQTEVIWANKLHPDWFRAIKFISKNELIKYSTVLRNHIKTDYSNIKLNDDNKVIELTDDESITNSKRMITISSIIFDFTIPKYFVVIDNYTILGVLKYLIMTEPYLLDINNLLPSDNVPLVKLKNLTNTVSEIVDNVIFSKVINDLDEIGNLPSFILLKDHLIANGRNTSLEKIEPLQLKKASTCIFLLNQIAIPRDYIFIDIEVIDWVNKTGRFEVVTNYQTKHNKIDYSKYKKENK